MATIMMTCPNTAVTVSTGSHATGSTAGTIMEAGGRFRCSACNQVHAWTKAHVALADWPGGPSRA